MKFLFNYLLCLSLLCILYVGTVCLIDPDGYIGRHYFPLTTEEARVRKPIIFTAYQRQGPVECLILGSSHCMRLRPAIFEKLLHWRCFNFGVPSARAEDLLAMYRYARSKGCHPKAIFVAVEPFSFDRDDSTKGLLLEQPDLRRLLGWHLSTRNDILRLGRHLYKSLSWLYLTEMMQSLLISFNGSFDHQYFAADGFQLDPQPEWIPTVHWQQDPPNKETLQAYIHYFTEVYGLTPERKDAFDQLIKEATKDNVKIIVWIPPIHPLAEAYFSGQTQYRTYLHLAQIYLHDLQRQYGITIFDSDNPQFSSLAVDGWIDYNHFDQKNADRISTDLAQGAR